MKFSKKIIGKHLSTTLCPHRISVKFYENGIVIKPISKQGMFLSKENEPLFDKQKEIFLTNECSGILYAFIKSFEEKEKIVNSLERSNEGGKD